MFAITVAANDYQYRHGAFRDATALWQELIELSERYGAINWQQQATSQITGLQAATGQLTKQRETEAVAAALGARLGPGLDRDAYSTALEMMFAVLIPAATGLELAHHRTRWCDDPELGPHHTGTLAGTVYGAMAAYAHAEAGATDQARRLLDALTPILDELAPAPLQPEPQHRRRLRRRRDLAPRRHRARPGLSPARPRPPRIGGSATIPSVRGELTVARMAALLANPGEATEEFPRGRDRVSTRPGGSRSAPSPTSTRQPFWPSAGPAHQPRVAELLDAATAAFEELGMALWLERALATKAEAESRRRSRPAARRSDRRGRG